MRNLLVMRHAKSDRSPVAGGDRLRPLAPRGRRAAAEVGRFLSSVGLAPELVLCSPAERALRTIALASGAGGWTCPVREEACLYEAGPEEVLALVASAPDEVSRLLVAGHEPTLSELVERLIGGAVRLPTGAVACIGFEVGRWSEIAAGQGVLLWLVGPKLINPLAAAGRPGEED